MSVASNLEARITYRKQLMIAEIVEHKKNCSRVGAAEAVDKLKDRLSELAHLVKASMVGGWANVGPSATLELEEWIAR